MSASKVLFAATVLVATLAVTSVSANVCERTADNGWKRYLSTDPQVTAFRTRYHKWQRDQWATWTGANKKLSELAWPGSHDASTYIFDPAYGYRRPRMPHNMADSNSAITQRLTFLDQLCVGARFFDLRVTYKKKDKTTVMRMVHPIAKNYLFETFDSMLDQLLAYARDHPGELLFPRIKCAKGTKRYKGKKCFDILDKAIEKLKDYLVLPGTVLGGDEREQPCVAAEKQSLLGSKTWAHVHGAVNANDPPSARNIVLMSFPGKKPGRVADQLGLKDKADREKIDRYVWNYKSVQDGDYSSSDDVEKVRQLQKGKFDDWTDEGRPNMFGYWYTSTAQTLVGDKSHVAMITAPFWAPSTKAQADGLEQSILREHVMDPTTPQEKRIQFNALVVDFVGVAREHESGEQTRLLKTVGGPIGGRQVQLTMPHWDTVMACVKHQIDNPMAPVQINNDDADIQQEVDLNDEENNNFLETDTHKHTATRGRLHRQLRGGAPLQH